MTIQAVDTGLGVGGRGPLFDVSINVGVVEINRRRGVGVGDGQGLAVWVLVGDTP